MKQSAGGQKSTIISINGQTVARSRAFYGYRYRRVTFIISTSLWIWEVVDLLFFQQHILYLVKNNTFLFSLIIVQSLQNVPDVI